MHSRITAQIAPLLTVVLLLTGNPALVEAGLMKIWQFQETAAAPVLLVGRVLSIQKGERVPDGSLPWKAETLAMTAEIQVLRSYRESVAAKTIKLRFFAYGPSVTQFVNGYPPPLPNIKQGQVLILPLQENKNPAANMWQLIADSGADLTISARPEIAISQPPLTARAFLDHEIANTLSRGTPPEVSQLASYLASQYEDLTNELLPLLESAIGDDRQRWAEVAANLLAAQGIPRPSVEDLQKGPAHQRLFLAQAALQKLKASPDTDNLLIKTWIAEAPLHAWGSANSLLEYAENPTTTETLRQALQDDLAGSSYIAWILAHNNHQANLLEALARALKVVDRPDADGTDLQGAAALLRDYGSDQDLKELATLVRKYQTQNEKFYAALWQYATEDGNPREARVLAVVLQDRRIVFKETRYCDFALGVLEKAVGQHFSSVPQALQWLKSQDLAN
jgi:hypothetical protein